MPLFHFSLQGLAGEVLAPLPDRDLSRCWKIRQGRSLPGMGRDVRIIIQIRPILFHLQR